VGSSSILEELLQVKIKETSENIGDLADAHKEFDLVSQSLKDLGTFLQGSPYKERAYDASVELPSRKEIAGKLKDIVLEHSGNTFSPEGYNSEGVHVDDYVKNWFNELYHEHRDKIHGSPFSDTFYSIDVVPNKQKQEHIFDIDTGRYEKRDTPHSHTMVWSKEYGSPEGTQKLRHFVAGSEVDAISGKRVPLHNQKFYKKDLEQLPEGESAGGEIPVALSNYIRNVILADRTAGKKITKILINKDLSSRHQALLTVIEGAIPG
jgi:hypothetical protein